MKDRRDFVTIRLTAAGAAFAGQGATLRIATARMHYLFEAQAPVEVLRAGEWPQLRPEADANGHPLFEVVDSPASAPAEAQNEEN